MTCTQHDVILQKLKNAEKEIERLKDENESLWFMLEELKDADKAMLEGLSEVILEGLDYNGFTLDDVKLVIPHQANLRITQTVQKKLGVSNDKIFSNIHKYGNTTAASIVIALSEALAEGKIKKGDIIVLASFGAGWYWGSVVMKW